MFTIVDPPAEFDFLNTRCRELVALVLERIGVPGETFKLRSSTPLYQGGEEKKYIYLLKEGNLSYNYKERTLFYFQEGDLLGFERELDIFTPTITSDFATILERFPSEDFIRAVHSDQELTVQWQEFLGRYIAALYVVARSLFKDTEPVLPEVRNYSEGAIILTQGDIGTEIFTMADGYADIMLDGTKVGTVLPDNVFGLFSAFTSSPAQASVVASTDCLILSLSKDAYVDLILSRPQVVKDLMKDMASLVVEGQKQLAGSTLKL